MRFLTTIAACFAAFAASPTLAGPLQPTGKWIVNFDDAQCIAQREYGTADKPMTLVFKQPPLGDVVQVGVITKGGPKEPHQMKGKILLGESPTDVTVLRYRPKDKVNGIQLVNLPIKAFAAAPKSTSLGFHTESLRSSFALDSMPDLLRLLHECVADLRTVWRVEMSEADRPLQGPNSTGLRSIFKSDDYPGLALEADSEGQVRMALLVDEKGIVADCTVVGSSGVAILDSQTCAIVRARAKFAPAVGPDGKPIKSAFIQRVVWRLG